jgi:hypothetical protein
LAFNYVAGDEGKVADASRILKITSPKQGNIPSSFEKKESEIKTSKIEFVESAYLKDKNVHLELKYIGRSL